MKLKPIQIAHFDRMDRTELLENLLREERELAILASIKHEKRNEIEARVEYIRKRLEKA